MKALRSAPIVMILIWMAGTLFLWGLAFYPVPEDAPQWLEVARQVCFGVVQNTLPNMGGWIVLVLAPLSFVIAALVAWPEELKGAARQIGSSPWGRILIGLALVAVIVEASWVKSRIEVASKYERFDYRNLSDEDLPLAYPRVNEKASDFALVDQSGASFRLSDYKDETLLLTFAFANCGTVCPVLIRQALDIGGEFSGVRVAVISLDPWRDTPKSLPHIAKKWNFGESAHMLSGSVEEVTTVLEQYNVGYVRDERTGDVTHPSLVYLIEPGGDVAYIFNNASNRWLRQALHRIVAGEGDATTVSR